ncbi:MAG TPA: polysaccharide deacetylase family protein [Longimicrobiaceae bacterium]|nr:polysaccharide deacetylase family protein [Longimicrobiaceae bacterium]
MPCPVAITFDDLPVMAFEDVPFRERADSAPERALVSDRILGTLARHGIPAAAFANTGRLRAGDGILRAWIDAGVEIGNHTASHRSVDDGSLEGWKTDVLACDAALREAVGRAVRYFRFPYLRTGAIAARKEEAADYLRTLGYRTVPATVTSAEWLLAHYYHLAWAGGDAGAMASVARLFVAHSVEALAAARALARGTVGREVPQIVLLHVNRLSADHLDAVLREWRARKHGFVTLEEALADPVFALPDRYVGPRGGSWLLRVAGAVDRGPGGRPSWFDRERDALLSRLQPIFGWPREAAT